MTCLIGVLLLALVPLFWFVVSNERTSGQRNRLIDRRPRGNEVWDYSREFNAVTYNQHLWALFCFRDPRRLYGPLTQQIWDAGK